jgi:hypothetical protein
MDSVFSKLASLVTVYHLQTSLVPDIPPDMGQSDLHEFLFETALEHGYDLTSRISLVRDNNIPIGWCNFESFIHDIDSVDQYKNLRVRDVMDPIRPDSLLAAGTSYFSAVEVFKKHNAPSFYFVLNDNEITGTLYYDDLFKLPARMCIFSLTLEIEQIALDLCKLRPKESWGCLSTARKTKIQNDYKRRHPDSNLEEVPYDDLLNATMFCDKGTILSKSNLLSKETSLLFKRILGKADNIRNACAHTGSESRLPSLLDRNRLHEFFKNCHMLINTVHNLIEKEAKAN